MKTIILILLATVSIACAGIKFNGVVTDVSNTTLQGVYVGDPFEAHINYDKRTSEITKTKITIGLAPLQFHYGSDGTSFTYQNDPCNLYVLWQVSQSQPAHLNVLLFAQTFCVIPPLEEFGVNNWTFFPDEQGQIEGVLTEIPEVHP